MLPRSEAKASSIDEHKRVQPGEQKPERCGVRKVIALDRRHSLPSKLTCANETAVLRTRSEFASDCAGIRPRVCGFRDRRCNAAGLPVGSLIDLGCMLSPIG